MTQKRRINRLERRAKPDERTVYSVHVPRPDESEEEIEATLAEAKARGGKAFRVRLPSPRDESWD